ncbi:MAG: regulatory protein RecX [Clostridia bacterium]|nr:regulatory protein RecX [Clostridia bacterium]
MIITKIEKQKKDKNRSSVFLDDKFGFGIDDFDLHILKLKVGMEISEIRLKEIKDTVLFSSAKEYALKLVSRFSYTKKTMCEKLFMRGYDDEITTKTIEFLENYKYIDDFEYSKKFISDALNLKHYGVSKIKYELSQKGIDSSVIESALSEFDLFQLEKECILPIARKKLSGNFEYKNIQKTKRYLISKGFSYELIDSVINSLINEVGE